MSAPANAAGGYCSECGTLYGQECIHQLMKGISADGHLTKTDSPMTTAADLSAATLLESWQPPTATQPRVFAHLLPQSQHISDPNNASLQSRLDLVEPSLEYNAFLASHGPRAVTAEPGTNRQDHSLQVTASDHTSSRSIQSPSKVDSPGSLRSSGHYLVGDRRTYISPANPSPIQVSTFKANRSHPRYYHPSDSLNAQRLYQTSHQNVQTHLPTMAAYPNNQVNPAAANALGSLRFGQLPSDADLQNATSTAYSLFRTFNDTSKDTTDHAFVQAHQEIPDPEGVLKSVDLGHVQNVTTYFPNALTAEAYRGACRPSVLAHDPSIPQDAMTKQAHVRLLVQAFNSLTHATDNKTMLQPFIDKRHDQKLVECLCWEILQAVIARAEFSEPLMMSYDHHKARDSVGLSNFAQRFDAVIQSMITCKTICKHMFDAPYLNIVVDDPLKAKARVDSNRALNAVKAKQMADGKKAQEIKAEEEGLPAPAPKRKRTSRVSTPTGSMQSPFRRNPRTPPRSITFPTRFADHSPMAGSPSGSSQLGTSSFPSSPEDQMVGYMRGQSGIGKQEYSNPPVLRGQRFAMDAQFDMLHAGQDNHIHPQFRQQSGMTMGPAPPGGHVPMQPGGVWNNSQYHSLSAYDANFSPHGSRQQISFDQDVNQYMNGESSEMGTTGGGYHGSGSGTDTEGN